MLRHDQDMARGELIHWVKSVHDMEGVATSVVFDGQGNEIEVQRPFGDQSFSVIFSPSGVTADSVIERMVGNSSDPARMGVVTGDRVLGHTVLATGGDVFSLLDLENWVERANREVRSFINPQKRYHKVKKRRR